MPAPGRAGLGRVLCWAQEVGSLMLHDLDMLVDLGGLGALVRVEGDVIINRCDRLASLDGLQVCSQARTKDQGPSPLGAHDAARTRALVRS